MPEYCLICPSCKNRTSRFRPVSLSSGPLKCPACMVVMNRDYASERVYAPKDNYAKPFISDSLAMNPCQIPEHNTMFPDVRVHSDGRPEFKNPRQHGEYLKATGFEKTEKKVKHGKLIKNP